MGVDRSDYILLGYEVSDWFDELDDARKDELYDKYYWGNKEEGNIVFLNDNYSGEYIYLGVILQADKDGFDGLSPFVFDDDFPNERNKIEELAWNEFSIDSEAQLIVLTHWH